MKRLPKGHHTLSSGMLKKWLLFFVLAIQASTLWGQQDSLTERKTSFIAFPVAFRLPETGFGGGAASIFNFYINKEDSLAPPSQLQFGFAYTQLDQVLVYLPFRLFWQERTWRAYGEIGYYKYVYPYYGVGNMDVSEEGESYEVDFPRIRLNALRAVSSKWYVGGRMWMDDFKMKRIEQNGILDSTQVTGYQGGVVFGLGVIAERDTRDNVYYPSTGTYTEFVWHPNQKGFISDFTYVRYRADTRLYSRLSNSTVLANQAFLDVVAGNPPFYAMAILGGPKRMRGIIEGRFRDQSALLLQTEIRQIVYNRWGLTAFGSYGQIANNIFDMQVFQGRFAGGAGVRFMMDREKKINLRLDVAWGEASPNIYFTVGEAF